MATSRPRKHAAPAAGGVALPWGVLALIVGLSSLVRLRLLDLPLERDEGEYAYVAQLLLAGVAPYADAYSMKTPGVAFLYAPFIALLGDVPAAVRTCLLLVHAATVVVVYALARRLYDPAHGLAAAAVFSVLALGSGVQGLFANAEHFVNFFALAGVLVLVGAERDGRGARLFAGGLLLGVAVLMKQHGLAFALFAGLAVVWPGGSRASRRGRWGDLLVFSLGVLAPVLLLLAALGWAGTLRPFIFWAVEYAWRYLSFVAPAEGIAFGVRSLAGVVAAAPFAWLLALIGLSAPIWDAGARSRQRFLFGFTLFSVVAVLPALRFRPHYFLFLLPAASLWAAVGSGALARRLAGARAVRLQVLLVAVALGTAVYVERDTLFRMDADEVSHATFGANPFPEALAVGRYLRAHSAEGDRIAVLASEPEIFFYAGRRSAAPFLYMTELLREGPQSRAMQREMIARLEEVQPRYLVFSSRFDPFDQRHGPDGPLFRWARTTARRDFGRVGVIELGRDRPSRYRWKGEAAPPPSSRHWLMVYERAGPSQPAPLTRP